MPKRYAREFRRSICERLVAGETVTRCPGNSRSRGHPLSLEAPSPHRHRRQRGCEELEADELAQAQKTIAELEAELEITKAEVALFNSGEPVLQKAVRVCPRPEQPGLSRTRRLPGRQGLTLVLPRVQVPHALGLGLGRHLMPSSRMMERISFLLTTMSGLRMRAVLIRNIDRCRVLIETFASLDSQQTHNTTRVEITQRPLHWRRGSGAMRRVRAFR